MNKSVFVVEGQSGSYDDIHSWPVYAFSSKKEAEEFCDFLENKAKEIGLHYDCIMEHALSLGIKAHDFRSPVTLRHRTKMMSEFDPHISYISCDGMSYSYYEVELR